MPKYLIIISVILLTCKSQERFQPTLLQLSDNQQITFLDSASASTAIISDTVEHFFDRINKLDMSIQLKKRLDTSTKRSALLHEYKISLQNDVLDFTVKDINFIKSVFQGIFKDCNKLSKTIFYWSAV